MKYTSIIYFSLLYFALFSIKSFSQINPSPNIGSTSNFLLFSGAGDITNAGTTSVYSGSVGTNFGILSGFSLLITPPSNLYTASPETAQCLTDLNLLYNDLSNRVGTARVGTYTTETITSGVYTTAGAVSIGGTLTLNGEGNPNAKFIITTGGAFTMGAGSKIILTNGAMAKNVYWVIAGACAIAANSEARGTFICYAGAISLGANCILQGNALTIAGAITTLDGMVLSQAPQNAMTLTASQSISLGSLPADLILVGNVSPVVKWQSATNSNFSTFTDIANYSNVLLSSCIGPLTTKTYFRAVIIENGENQYSNVISISIIVPTVSPSLGAAGPFVLFTTAGAITEGGTSTTSLGAIGTAFGAITGFPVSLNPLLHVQDALTLSCKDYLQQLFNTIKAYPTTNATHPVAFGGGEILIPGVYEIGAASTMSGILTLDGQNTTDSVFIIKIVGALALAADTQIVLVNGTNASNVFFVVDGAVGIGANCTFTGTVICQAGAIAIGNACIINGRIFTIAGAITVANATFSLTVSNTLTSNDTLTATNNQVVNFGTQPSNLSVSGATGLIARWEKSSSATFINSTSILNTTTTLTGIEIGPLTATTYFRAVQLNGSITTYSSIVTITVSPLTIAGTLSSSQSYCTPTIPNALTLNGTNGNVTKWQKSADSSFTNPINISFTNSTPTLTSQQIGLISTTTYFRAEVQNCSCGVVYSNIISVLINELSLLGSVSSDQEFCSPTQPTTLVLSGNSAAVLKWQSSLTSDFAVATDIANTTSILEGNSIGIVSETTYFRAVTQNCNLTLLYSLPSLIAIAPSTTWNGNSWSNGLPSFSKSAVFAGNFTAITSIESCSLTVNAGAVVVINSGSNVTLGGALMINSLGSFTLNNNTNLLQPEGVANTGIIKVKRNSSPLYRLDSTLWSSPVSGQNLKSFSPATLSNRFYFYDSTASVNGAYATVFNNSLYPGPIESSYTFELSKGYLIRAPNTFASYIPAVLPATTSAVNGVSFQGLFTGSPNNGTINSPLNTSLNGFNLIGNPYPSSISIASFFNANSETIDGTLWFWRKINDLGTGIGYATVTNAGITSIQPGIAELFFNGTLSTGQGFFVKVKNNVSPANVVFTNAMRSSDTSNLFFKNQNTLLSEKHRIWLNLSNSNEVLSQNLIGYLTGATNDVDFGIEGKSFGNNDIELSSIIDSDLFNIQGRSLPFDPSDSVALNFKTTIAGNYSISIDHVDGLFENNQDIFLNDVLLGTMQNLKLAPYTFSSQIGNFDSRFQMIYQNQLGTNTPISITNKVLVFKQNGFLKISSSNIEMSEIEIHDMSGRLLEFKKAINDKEITLFDLAISNQFLMVKIKTVDSEIVIKKFIY